ncbi:uncharacterized protein LOC144762967 [Lissotriton helveticus]
MSEDLLWCGLAGIIVSRYLDTQCTARKTVSRISMVPERPLLQSVTMWLTAGTDAGPNRLIQWKFCRCTSCSVEEIWRSALNHMDHLRRSKHDYTQLCWDFSRVEGDMKEVFRQVLQSGRAS